MDLETHAAQYFQTITQMNTTMVSGKPSQGGHSIRRSKSSNILKLPLIRFVSLIFIKQFPTMLELYSVKPYH